MMNHSRYFVAPLIALLLGSIIVPSSFGFVVPAHHPLRPSCHVRVSDTVVLRPYNQLHWDERAFSSSSSSVMTLRLVPPSAHDMIAECTTTASSRLFLLIASGGGDDAVSSWRQYVPLGVISLVLLDILLGSPAANAVLAPLKQDEQGDNKKASEEGNDTAPSSLLGSLLGGQAGEIIDGNSSSIRRKERIDTDQVARAAIDKARNTLELKRYLEESKSDWDRMEDIKKKLDADMENLDENLEERGKELEERRKKGGE